MDAVTNKNSTSFKSLAAAGLIAKGVVYCVLGLLAFMAAFRLNGKSTSDTDQYGAFSFVKDLTGGKILLAVIAAGLLCYTIWRMIQAFSDTERKGNDLKGIAKRTRYFLSGLLYLSVAAAAAKMIFSDPGNADQKQGLATSLFSHSYGPWLVGIIGILFIVIGFYQAWYGLSEKFKKNISMSDERRGGTLLNGAAKLGYVARGITWLLVGWLFVSAAWHANASEAGDSSKAFSSVSNGEYGTYILAAIGIGLICYGGFNFIRARFEKGS